MKQISGAVLSNESTTFPWSQDGLRAGRQAVSKGDIHGENYDALARIIIVFIALSLLRVVLAFKTFTTFSLDLIRLLQSVRSTLDAGGGSTGGTTQESRAKEKKEGQPRASWEPVQGSGSHAGRREGFGAGCSSVVKENVLGPIPLNGLPSRT